MTSVGMRALVASLILTGAVVAGMAAEQNASEVVEVKRAEVKDPKHSSLRFLRDNRNFLRAQLDQLRLQTTRTSADALPLDARYLRLKEMSAEIAAARDAAAAESLLTAQRNLLESVTQLGELEMELNAIEELLALQRANTMMLYKSNSSHRLDAAIAGKMLPTIPGDENWAWQTVAGIPADTITLAQQNALEAKRCGWVEDLGLGPTHFLGMTSATGAASGPASSRSHRAPCRRRAAPIPRLRRAGPARITSPWTRAASARVPPQPRFPRGCSRPSP